MQRTEIAQSRETLGKFEIEAVVWCMCASAHASKSQGIEYRYGICGMKQKHKKKLANSKINFNLQYFQFVFITVSVFCDEFRSFVEVCLFVCRLLTR